MLSFLLFYIDSLNIKEINRAGSLNLGAATATTSTASKLIFESGSPNSKL